MLSEALQYHFIKQTQTKIKR